MNVRAIELLPAAIPLVRPYAVASHAVDTAHLVRVRIAADGGAFGLGAATPEPVVTGETFAACCEALRDAAAWLPGTTFADPRELASVLRERLPHAPGARAALDMALFDLWGKVAGRPVVDLLGRVHDMLPTSITIGLRDLGTTLAEAREYRARGFRVIKVKVGHDLDLDVERLSRLRDLLGPSIGLLADGNVGYTPEQLVLFLRLTRTLDLWLVEQPLPRSAIAAQRALPASDVRLLCADESVHDAAEARTLAAEPRAFGAFNIKLMKCGGITEALAIANVAATAGIHLMWGCMDESVVGIAAALHAAFACPATRWLDLDGSFDLSRDFADGGFALADGMLRTLDRPGLGVQPLG